MIRVKNSAWQRPSSGSHASLRPHHAVDASTRTYRAPAPAAESCPHRPTVPTHQTPATMGNTMNVAVISQVYQSNRQELLALKKKAEKDGKKLYIGRAGRPPRSLVASMRAIGIFMKGYLRCMTKEGNDEVPSKPFLSGLATITNNTLEERIHIALEIWDEKGSGYLSQEDVQSCFVSMAKTCEYFGDDRMDFEQLEELVQSMFDTFDADLVDLKMKYRDRHRGLRGPPDHGQFISGGRRWTGKGRFVVFLLAACKTLAKASSLRFSPWACVSCIVRAKNLAA